MTTEGTAPVTDWATDYDVFDLGYVEDPYPTWARLRQSCPIAHTERFEGSWLPTRYDDVLSIAYDTDHFSSRNVSVVPPPKTGFLPYGLPPITSDPPDHGPARRLILPWFSHTAVARYEPYTRALCRSLIDGFRPRGHADAAADYAQQIPVRVIATMLGVPSEMADTFTEWVRSILEFAHDEERRMAGRDGLVGFFAEQIARRRASPGDDLISELLQQQMNGEPLSDAHVLGTAALTLIAGVDTTWSAIGSALWHLATHPADRDRLVDEPELIATACEELLRGYSPVTMARVATQDTEVGGCPIKAGDRVLLNFPAANRDPSAFPDADKVIIDRQENRHIAFGVGIHRCAGSNLARMELRVALEEWLAALPAVRLAENSTVTWSGGQVRGPRSLPVVF